MHLLKILSVILILNSCNSTNDKEHDQNSSEDKILSNQEKKYTCPMHPEIIRYEPGQCPICKMDLVEMKGDESKLSEIELDALLKPTNKYVISQVKTVAMKRQTVPSTIQVTGKIDYDTKEISTISSKVEGRIEKLYVKYLYQPVSKGQKLMDIYSKELVTEQENFIYLLKNDPDNTKLIKTAEDRLMLQGLTPDQVKKIKTEKKAIDYIGVYSSYSGHLHDLLGDKSSDMSTMNKQPQKELLIREGMYVKKGQAVFNIYSTNKLWALLNVYPENHGSIVKGQMVNLFVDGKELSGNFKIDFIEPEIKPNQNTVTARVYLSNLNGAIKVGSNVKGTINTSEKTGYYIPATSVVDLGSNYVVFLKENNLFRAHKVLVGSVLNDMVEIISGIKESDLIAENAQLLMDSESFIKTDN